ncbi:DUF2157 domain-containing protein [Aureivirga sp. CE67]|uniref:DUF2157 domain-containing protein n=1 Tax=Aureivirga sp. CE67 TaxID=1788983 RepID=UPI0018CB4298|nr:DUF2157 domain-containing protein [Aureivirga sp. CE67]
MEKITRKELGIISQNSNLTEKEISQILEKDFYTEKNTWLVFLKYFFLSVGAAFLVAGIIFFFAYNWADLNKFVKIGIIETLIVVVTTIILFTKTSELFKNILLTVASFLVGVLFAVFGQIYQTGANAYDFFLGWTVFITIWAVVSNFAPLWLLYIILVNSTFVFYTQQIATYLDEIQVGFFLFTCNIVIYLIFLILPSKLKTFKIEKWFLRILELWILTITTTTITIGIFSKYNPYFYVLLLSVIVLYTTGLFLGYKKQNLFYLGIIPVSILIIICSFLLNISFDVGMLFVISGFVVTCITLLILNLIKLQKKWKIKEI